jgi:hypothetical protein
VIFERRPDARYFLTMSYQEPDSRSESHDPYVVLNRLRTLLVTHETLDVCEGCESKNAYSYTDSEVLKNELKKQYQEVDQLFACINAFAEKVVAYFDQHTHLCDLCQTKFHAGATAAQAMQDTIYENPETPDTTWLASRSNCLEELLSPASHQNGEEPQREPGGLPPEEEVARDEQESWLTGSPV